MRSSVERQSEEAEKVVRDLPLRIRSGRADHGKRGRLYDLILTVFI
jgi:hypothetical protein